MFLGANPEGILKVSPGLRYTATQGGGNAYYGFTPTVLRHIRAHTVWENLRNSVGVEKREGETLLTQGSGVPQPWAMLWNPVGILNTYGGISAPFSLGPRPLKFCGSRDCHKRAKRDGTVPALRTVSAGSVHTTISPGFAGSVYTTPAKKRDSLRRGSRLSTMLMVLRAPEAVPFFALFAFSTFFSRTSSPEILRKQGLSQASEARRDCPCPPNGFRRERTHHHFPGVCR